MTKNFLLRVVADAHAEKEIEGEGGIQASLIQFVFLCMFYTINPVFSGPNEGCRSGTD